MNTCFVLSTLILQVDTKSAFKNVVWAKKSTLTKWSRLPFLSIIFFLFHFTLLWLPVPPSLSLFYHSATYFRCPSFLRLGDRCSACGFSSQLSTLLARSAVVDLLQITYSVLFLVVNKFCFLYCLISVCFNCYQIRLFKSSHTIHWIFFIELYFPVHLVV